MKDQEVLKMIQQGDEKALDYLYKKNYRMMCNLVLKNNGTEDEAKDIYQEALIVFWQKAQSKDFELSSKISTYLYSVCQNLWRKELTHKSRLSRDQRDVAYVEDFGEQEERHQLLHECMNMLGETCRQVLWYCYFDRLSMEDIAQRMGFANANTAKTKKYKCKKELDKIVKDRFSESDFLD